MKKRDWILYAIIFVISLAYVFMIIDVVITHDYISLLWTCYLAIPLIIIGLIKRNSGLILSQVIILIITDLFWIFDFLCLIFLGHTVFGIDIVKNFPYQSLIIKLGNLQHLVVTPLSIVALSILKVKKSYKILLISFGELIVLFLLTLLFAPHTSFINCVYQGCVDVPLNFLPYPLIWFIFSFGFVSISYFILTSLPFLKKKS